MVSLGVKVLSVHQPFKYRMKACRPVGPGINFVSPFYWENDMCRMICAARLSRNSKTIYHEHHVSLKHYKFQISKFLSNAQIFHNNHKMKFVCALLMCPK